MTKLAVAAPESSRARREQVAALGVFEVVFAGKVGQGAGRVPVGVLVSMPSALVWNL